MFPFILVVLSSNTALSAALLPLLQSIVVYISHHSDRRCPLPFKLHCGKVWTLLQNSEDIQTQLWFKHLCNSWVYPPETKTGTKFSQLSAKYSYVRNKAPALQHKIETTTCFSGTNILLKMQSKRKGQYFPTTLGPSPLEALCKLNALNLNRLNKLTTHNDTALFHV